MMLATLTAMSMYVQLPILVLVISLVYSATRYDDWNSILIEGFRWGSRMVLFLAVIAVILWFVAYLISNPASTP